MNQVYLSLPWVQQAEFSTWALYIDQDISNTLLSNKVKVEASFLWSPESFDIYKQQTNSTNDTDFQGEQTVINLLCVASVIGFALIRWFLKQAYS